jgi:NADP-dependent aldehyde dehydrogenase
MNHIQSRNPRTGSLQFEPLEESSAADVDRVVKLAHGAGAGWSRVSAAGRADALEAIANHLERQASELADLAEAETALGATRLAGEVGRTTFQLRLFASELRSGVMLAAESDSPVEGPPPGGRPRLDRKLVPLGPVAVFGASNFPFAFGELGGDTASALAAGCAVVVKEHPGHPVLAARVIGLAREALAESGHNPDIVSGVRGLEAGKSLVVHDLIAAVGFTGSQGAGRFLYDLASSRTSPIPFYGELGSMNPVFISQAALDTRAIELAAEAAGSISLGLGQFCTKPALIFVPAHEAFLDTLSTSLGAVEPGPLLGEHSQKRFLDSVDTVKAVSGVTEHVALRQDENLRMVGPGLLTVSASDFLDRSESLLEECFGPIALVILCDSEDEFGAAIEVLPGCLVATIHANPASDQSLVGGLVDRLERKAGRIVINQWPTGLAVSHAQHHGGTYPASTSPLHTSVGSHAMMRFVRPVVLQNLTPGEWPLVVSTTTEL